MVKITSAISLILLIMVTGCSNESDHASTPSPVVSTTPQVTVVPIRLRNIDLQAKKISREETWYDVWRVIDAVKSELPVKDSYESKAEYKARIKDFGSKVLFDDVSLKGNFIFPLQHQFFEYDPELKGFKYYDFATSVSSSSSKFNSLKVGDRAGPEDGQTLGMIEAWKQLNNRPIKNRSYAFVEDAKKLPDAVDVKVFYKTDPESAKKIHGKLKAYVVGTINYPFLYRVQDHPAGDGDTLADVNVLSFSISGVWLVNSETGEVLSKSYKLVRNRD